MKNARFSTKCFTCGTSNNEYNYKALLSITTGKQPYTYKNLPNDALIPYPGSVAEWSKALVLGTSPQGRGFESHRCKITFCTFCISGTSASGRNWSRNGFLSSDLSSSRSYLKQARFSRILYFLNDNRGGNF